MILQIPHQCTEVFAALGRSILMDRVTDGMRGSRDRRLRIVTADTVSDTLDWLEFERPDVVLLDLALKDPGRAPLWRQLARLAPLSQVVLLTSSSTGFDFTQASLPFPCFTLDHADPEAFGRWLSMAILRGDFSRSTSERPRWSGLCCIEELFDPVKRPQIS